MVWHPLGRRSWLLRASKSHVVSGGAAFASGLVALSVAMGSPSSDTEVHRSREDFVLPHVTKFVVPDRDGTGTGNEQGREAGRVLLLAQEKPQSAPRTTSAVKSWTNSLGMEFVPIPAGEFTMGSTAAQIDKLLKLFPDVDRAELLNEQPAHRVRLTKPFELSKYKVTVGQLRQFLTATGRLDSRRQPWYPQEDNHPAVNLSWNEANAFCEWLTKKEGGKAHYRLPTEAEWEYACRAGSTTIFPNGDDPEKLALIANVADASARRRYKNWSWTIKADDGYVYTSPVGSFAPNAWGLCDMVGDAWEWCEDGYSSNYYRHSPAVDPTGPAHSPTRVARGSSWFVHPRRCRPADRGGFVPDFRCGFLGFRVAVTKP